MKQKVLLLVLGLVALVPCQAQEPIYRCGNEYTNTKPDGRGRDCKLLSGGNVTVVQGTRVPRPAASRVNSAASDESGGPSTSQREQGTQVNDARLILQSELRKAQARQEQLQKEYNNGQPEILGGEARNHQKYLDRVAALKADLARNESDMAGIRRELDRLPATSGNVH